MTNQLNFPRQMLPFSKKNKKWRKECVSWANQKTFFNNELVRKTIIHKKINYDLLNGKLHPSDLEATLNPDGIDADYITDTVQHFPIINSKINLLRGENFSKPFDYKLIITNPTAISEIENNKREELFTKIKELIEDTSISEEDFEQKLSKLDEYYNYEWQDLREIRGTQLLKHYEKEYNMPLIFNNGYVDALTVGEEIYQCDIVGGEPILDRIDPLKIRVFRSGYSEKIEDADLIILEDYWSPGKVIDHFYDKLSDKDIEFIENTPNHMNQGVTDSMGNIDERYGLFNNNMLDDTTGDGFFFDPSSLFSTDISTSLLPYDLAGNLRVLRLFWKSKRRILKVKSYDPETGEESYEFYPEDYQINTDLGEESTSLWINEAWEGTLIANDIFINMRPRLVQYNRISNPSRCHFGIIGSIYTLNSSKPYSLVDMMKPYNYLYNATHDRLNKTLAKNWGPILELDTAKVPKDWDVDKWLYYVRVNNLAVTDSFKEGTIGASTGKLAGGMNNASKGIIDTNIGNYIQQLINLLEFIKMEMSEVVGITRQREGQISNRETVGGVERSTLQSNHITEWYNAVHNDVKKRVLECFLETAKIALKGRSKKFPYILSDNSMRIMDIDGDEFAEADYGLVVDTSSGVNELQQKIESLAQAALQNQTLSFSTIAKLFSSSSIAEKTRFIEKDEQARMESASKEAQQLAEAQQQQAEMLQEQAYATLQQKEEANIRDNETKILIAQISAENNEDDGIVVEEFGEEARANLMEKIRQFDEKLKLDKDRLKLDRDKMNTDASIKRKALTKNTNIKK